MQAPSFSLKGGCHDQDSEDRRYLPERQGVCGYRLLRLCENHDTKFLMGVEGQYAHAVLSYSRFGGVRQLPYQQKRKRGS